MILSNVGVEIMKHILTIQWSIFQNTR